MQEDTFTLMFIDTCNGRHNVFNVSENSINAVISQVKFPQAPSHQGFVFSHWSETAKDIISKVQSGEMLPGQIYDVIATYVAAHVVKFVDGYDDSVVAVQTVADGANAVPPADFPLHGKYSGICWDKDLTNVKQSFETHVVYVDISNFARKALAHKAVNNLRDIAAIQNSLKNIFTWIPGERILLPEFGSQLRKLLYEGITDYNVERIAAEIRRSVSEWEPRVQVQDILDVSNVNDTEDNTVHLQVLYTIPGLTDETFAYDINYASGG